MKYFLVLMLSLLVVACGKDVSSDGNPDVKITPGPGGTSPDGNGGGGNGIVYDGEITSIFAGQTGGLVNSKTISSDLIITLPLHIQTSYELTFPKPRLDLVLNNQYLCSYSYSNETNKYEVNANCDLAVNVNSGDLLTLFGVPESQTVTLKINYQNQ